MLGDIPVYYDHEWSTCHRVFRSLLSIIQPNKNSRTEKAHDS